MTNKFVHDLRVEPSDKTERATVVVGEDNGVNPREDNGVETTPSAKTYSYTVYHCTPKGLKSKLEWKTLIFLP